MRRTPSAGRGGTRGDQVRLHIAVEAARLMSEHGIRDFHLAKRKAAERLGVQDGTMLPKNSEIEDALREHQRLFQADAHPRLVRTLRETARDALRFFSKFQPRLVGAVLEGTADQHSAICLHLFCDAPEDVSQFLSEQGIPYDQQSRNVRLTRDDQREFPVLLFSADNHAMDLTVFPHDLIRQAPLDRIDGHAMQRASLNALQELLSTTAE